MLAKLPEESADDDALPGAEPASPRSRTCRAGSTAPASRASPSARPARRPSSRPAAGTFLPLSIDAEGAVAPAELITVEPEDPRPITAVSFLLGGQSVVFGDEAGRVSSWFRVRTAENPNLRLFRKIHVFEPMPAAVTAIGISTRNKGFVTADAKGDIWLRYNTSDRTLLRFSGRGSPADRSPESPGRATASSKSRRPACCPPGRSRIRTRKPR